MSLNIKIKPEFAKVRIGFNNSADPLGKRSEADLRDLALLAHHSNENYKQYFAELPTAKQLLDSKGDAFLEKTEAPKKALPPATETK